METSRIISDRYLLQRMIKQGQICTIYQGTDQRLQRSVAIKVIPAPYIHVYKAAVRLTAQFSHPNIVGLYDIISEPETFYLVQEYVEGNDFTSLLAMQLTPYEVADLGSQLCQALLYAYLHPIRRVSHGDLTPASVMRDHKGVVKVNNFALPSDISYFTLWSSPGGPGNDGDVVADRELPWGQYSDRRQADDTRAVGLLLYQLLASRSTGSLSVEPPPDGRLRFTRNIPPELCDLVARTLVRQHPQYISTVEALYSELRPLADTLEPVPPVEIAGTYAQEQFNPRQFHPSTASGKLVTSLPLRENAPVGLAAYRENSPNLTALEPTALTVADSSVQLASARQTVYPEMGEKPASRRLSLSALIVLCLVIFALFFIVGYFGGHLLFPQ
ncbi:MAG TPA: protein kinase [Ktedonobacteraceae bacterium]|nr:protein kinase [Ktedonobacteraceae bacterium]